MLGEKETNDANDANVARYHPGWILCRSTCPDNCAGLPRSALWAKLGADHGVVAGDLAGGDSAVGQHGRLLLWPSALGVLGEVPLRRRTTTHRGRRRSWPCFLLRPCGNSATAPVSVAQPERSRR